MTSAELEYAEKRMRQKWYDLVMAEQNGASIPALERMYNAYILAVEEYNRCSAEHQREQQEQQIPAIQPQEPLPTPAVDTGKRKRKAS